MTALLFIAVSLPFLLAYPPQIHRIAIDLRNGALHDQPKQSYHRLVITADGRTFLDGAKCGGLIRLRMALDPIAIDDAALEIRPDPELRYEAFLEILAVVKRSNISHLHFAADKAVIPVPGFVETRHQPSGPPCDEPTYRPLPL